MMSHRRLCLKVAAAVLALLLPAVGARANKDLPDCYVLSVGIDTYNSRVKNLRGCANDAKTAANLFARQEATMFGRVQCRLLTDQAASRSNIDRELERLQNVGRAGDFVVLFLSGHGGNDGGAWHFLPYDYNPSRAVESGLSDHRVLGFADSLAGSGKKVVVIIDACFAGQVRLRAKPFLDKHQNAQGGGIVLMLSSMPGQTSAALGNYSAFAEAVAEGLSGRADANSDRKITIGEVRRFAYHRVYELLRQRGIKEQQDGECDYSPSLSDAFVLAVVGSSAGQSGVAPNMPALPDPVAPTAPDLGSAIWVGRESLAGYGSLRFELQRDGAAIMTDAKQQTRGSWVQRGAEITIRFKSCTYVGQISGGNLSGNAAFTDGRSQSWSFAATRETDAPAPFEPPQSDLPRLGNTIWVGQESLAGFGQLRFELQADGTAVMTDAESQVRGAWTQRGTEITIRFSNCNYVGHLNGAELSGSAGYSDRSRQPWSFRVVRQGL